MLEIIGYAVAALIGLSLGLIGSGGSIVTVPVLVYLFHLPPLTAIAYSLFIVGTASLVGSVNNVRKKQVDLRIVLFFGASSAVTVFIIRHWLIPVIPDDIATVGGFTISFSFLTMMLFALLMLLSAYSMLRKKKPRLASSPKSLLRLILNGIIIGVVTGLLGAGGGFLLIPVLVFFFRLDMKKAVGTSLAIIAMNTFIGFVGSAGHTDIQWPLLLTITTMAVAGILLGGKVAAYVKPDQLKKGFGWFVMMVAIYIIIREVATLADGD